MHLFIWPHRRIPRYTRSFLFILVHAAAAGTGRTALCVYLMETRN